MKTISELVSWKNKEVTIPLEYINDLFLYFAKTLEAYEMYKSGNFKNPDFRSLPQETISEWAESRRKICLTIDTTIRILKLYPLFTYWCEENNIDCWTFQGLEKPTTITVETKNDFITIPK